MNKANPNKGENIAQFPGGELSDEFHEGQALALRPDDLTDLEQAVWDRIAPELNKLGRLKKIYIDVIAEYCRIVARMAAMRKVLDAEEWTHKTTGRHGDQLKSRPEVAQLNDDWRKFRSLVSELGLSPSAEKTLNAAQGDLFENEFKQF